MAASICKAVTPKISHLSLKIIVNTHYRPSVFVFRHNLSSSSLEANSSPEIDVEKLFLHSDVQNILTRITGYDLDKIFPVVPSAGKEQMKIELMTKLEVEKTAVSVKQRSLERLQMPPYMKPRTEDTIVLAENPEVVGYEDHKLVFTDISQGLPEKSRTMVVREPTGMLRLAKPSERDRIFQIYFPKPGRSLHVPQMFESQHLERLLKEEEYIYILERACVQFEPNDPKFIEVCRTTFDFVDKQQHFEQLRSTRHFGSLTFYLIVERRIDALLTDCVRRMKLADAADVVRVFHIVYPNSNSAIVASKNKNLSDEQLLQAYIANDARDPGPLELSLQVYKETISSSQLTVQASTA